jgi:hypothetical protein
MPNEARRAILILGMHRSGTSAVAGTAVRLGAAGPRTPLDASADNPAGFHESAQVMILNHSIMRDAGSSWNLSLHRTTAQICAAAPPYRPAMAAVLEQEFGRAPLFVMKDPRLCLTLPGWRPVLQVGGIETSAFLVVRHPGEVARSLLKRNNLPEVISVAEWLHHTLEAEYSTRGMKRAALFYDDLMTNWKPPLLTAAHQAGITWPLPMEAVEISITSYLSQDLRHQRTRLDEPLQMPEGIIPLVQKAWLALQRMRQAPDDPAVLAELDTVRNQFATWRQQVLPPDVKVVWPHPV